MLEQCFSIGEKTVETGGRPYIIAEAGSNHNQDMDTARAMIDAAADAGVDAVKFQLFLAEKLYPGKDGFYDIFKSIELDRDWVLPLADYARARGLHFMATPFDKDAVDLLVEAGAPAFKVASSEAVNRPLLAKIAATGLPIVLATGMCDLVDVHEAANFCSNLGNAKLALLQCGAVYPLPEEDANLAVMDTFAAVFGCPVGFSDHTLGLGAPVAAVARGAAVIEKHFTLDRASEGPDHFYAVEPGELKQLVELCTQAHAAVGCGRKKLLPKEREFGRRDGLYAARDLEAGRVLSAEDIAIERPAVGIRDRHLAGVLGLVVARGVRAGEPLGWAALAGKEEE